MKHFGTEITEEEERIHKFFNFPLRLDMTNGLLLIKNSDNHAFIKFEKEYLTNKLIDVFMMTINGEAIVLRLEGVNFYISNEVDTDYLMMNNQKLFKFASEQGFQSICKRMGIPDGVTATDFRYYFLKMIESRFNKLIARNYG